MAEITSPRPQFQPVPDQPARVFGVAEQTQHANPDEFGAQIGQAQEKLGETEQRFGQQAAGVATNMIELNNDLNANRAVDYYAQQENDLLFKQPSTEGGNDGGLFTKTGTAYLQAFDDTKQKLLELRQSGGQGLSIPAQLKYDDYTRRSMFASLTQMGERSVRETQQAATDTLQGTVSTLSQKAVFQAQTSNLATNLGAEPAAHTIGDVWDTAMRAGVLGGRPPDVQKQMAQEAVGSTVDHIVRSLLSQGNYAEAQSYRDQFGSAMDGKSIAMVDAILEPARNQILGRGIGTSVLSDFAATPPGQPFTPKAPAKQSSNINDAIFQQESGNRSNAPTSVAGAVGPGQIIPATFAKYAKPGEVITNPDDNRAVSNRYIDDLKSKFPDDPARVAVGYFSGIGNVSPPGSATPWVKDTADATGKTVSSYVADVSKRLGQSSGAGAQLALAQTTPPPDPLPGRDPVVLSDADRYRVNYGDIIQAAYDKAAAKSDDPRLIDASVKFTKEYMDRAINAQDQKYKADNDIVLGAISGAYSKGVRPGSEDKMIQISPQVADAWGRMQVNNTRAVESIRSVFDKRDNKDTNSYGEGFFPLYQHIWSDPKTDPDHIFSEQQLMPYLGKDGGINTSGITKLRGEISANQDPAKHVFGSKLSEFMGTIRAQIVNDNPLAGQHDVDGQYQLYLYQNMVDEKVKEYSAPGSKKNPFDLITPGKPDYLGAPDVVSQYHTTTSKSLETQINRARGGFVSTPVAPPGTTTQPGQVPATTGILPRQPGETAQQYLDRIGSK